MKKLNNLILPCIDSTQEWNDEFVVLRVGE